MRVRHCGAGQPSNTLPVCLSLAVLTFFALAPVLDNGLIGIDDPAYISRNSYVPRGMHLVNLLFHIANTAAVFLLLRTMTGALWRSALAAALFGIHPLHVESVAWVVRAQGRPVRLLLAADHGRVCPPCQATAAGQPFSGAVPLRSRSSGKTDARHPPCRAAAGLVAPGEV